ncbi:hypothetical protein A2276_07815 [candidate division WOR-1 bacterium RIFOXYA12_FULL_43_27]|uniref:Uncharacterized protein n=1 Tax=candidate division WOR-1 bacterium RIFOXYC2_FULL_46_14 TaxID=1802587 RepID=A0A1F4U5V3_UNCSA|nr:MAG: hypothetical protein A2276_07815 [candidate division WOR-1 bacterium RIFOXYA12_FULL_43_27]OGC20504.1 MAG: hypothetical protein A2292_05640 [candidate division WOR-1 bacterium RIFOXYB2_FULL_46_45]OGC31759.1 MAG: hypothetical protein A2232_05810 [candidate division WOR-1 bacterium RIFOXYA2_FULL_46_56]OGC40348.1 MAG: hypothetical protein A2438_03660 [candidate division WOR-1 bacterium RIFOXYC2_FULL_46_14]
MPKREERRERAQAKKEALFALCLFSLYGPLRAFLAVKLVFQNFPFFFFFFDFFFFDLKQRIILDFFV